MRENKKGFVVEHVLYLLDKTGESVSRPLATFYCSTLNQTIDSAYISLSNSLPWKMYVLHVKDDISGYRWPSPMSSATAESAAQGLFRWRGTFSALNYGS